MHVRRLGLPPDPIFASGRSPNLLWVWLCRVRIRRVLPHFESRRTRHASCSVIRLTVRDRLNCWINAAVSSWTRPWKGNRRPKRSKVYRGEKKSRQAERQPLAADDQRVVAQDPIGSVKGTRRDEKDVDAGRRRVAIEGVSPEIDSGRFPIKRTVGQEVVVHAAIFADGHDQLRCMLKWRTSDAADWNEIPMKPLGNDRWEAEFKVAQLTSYWYTLVAWADRFLTWQHDLQKRVAAGQEVPVELLIGADLVADAIERAAGHDRQLLLRAAETLRDPNDPNRVEYALSASLAEIMARYPDRRWSTKYDRQLEVVVDRERARFSAWYELFPRSCGPTPGRHGRLRDCEPWIRRIARMGFDVVYLPPIHPIGRTHRKGRNNAVVAGPADPGSPWAIGAAEGGHKSIHPELGTLEDFRWLIEVAKQHGVEIAMDIAFQCSPDHPYVREHPQWFRSRPDGTIQYAENPPKKYQDIYPFDFETDDWPQLWEELKSVMVFWAEQGIRIFRVDNPHTKPYRFWEWAIRETRRQYPETIFLSEAFTRPWPKYHLAKSGFTQSYTYFTWRNTKYELIEYLTDLMHSEKREYCRPNLWPNTPDILPEYLQFGGRPAFMARLVLAATLSGNYGVYGPPFEHYVGQPREVGSEDYHESEKYEIRHWDPNTPGSLDEFMRRVNQIRHENAALQNDRSLHFEHIDNDQILSYTKQSADGQNLILVVVNLDPYHKHSGWLELRLEELDLPADRPYQVHDLLGDGRYLWSGRKNYVELDPQIAPAQIFRIRRRVRTEQQFEYYL
jgi:starch synthase (maltosyl-transferring)